MHRQLQTLYTELFCMSRQRYHGKSLNKLPLHQNIERLKQSL
jgi:hypothetical protein